MLDYASNDYSTMYRKQTRENVMAYKYESVNMVVSTHSRVAPVDQWIEHQRFTQKVTGSRMCQVLCGKTVIGFRFYLGRSTTRPICNLQDTGNRSGYVVIIFRDREQ